MLFIFYNIKNLDLEEYFLKILKDQLLQALFFIIIFMPMFQILKFFIFKFKKLQYFL